VTTFARVETLVDDAAARRPDHPALICGERRWTYVQLRAEMDRRAALLVEAGCGPGDVVATNEPASDNIAISFLACCRAHLPFFYLSPKLARTEIASFAARARVARILTAGGGRHPAVPGLSAVPLAPLGMAGSAAVAAVARRAGTGSADDILLVQMTSGTTGGTPKLALLPHRYHTWTFATPFFWEREDAVTYVPRPNSLAVHPLVVSLRFGATIILSAATEPDRMDAEMAAHRATVLVGVPATYRLLVERRRAPISFTLDTLRTTGAPLPLVVHRAAVARYSGVVGDEYASTEGGMMIATPHRQTPVGSIGIPVPGSVIRLLDEQGADVADGEIGEIVARAPGMMCGYLDDPAATDRTIRDGWLWTGDLARRDADGYYFLVGRRTLRINVGGFKVAPEEVEATLLQHPGVRDVVVLGVADAARGAAVRAVIVPEGDPPMIGELRRYCRERLASYKVPRHWEFRDELPRSPLGKVLRHKL